MVAPETSSLLQAFGDSHDDTPTSPLSELENDNEAVVANDTSRNGVATIKVEEDSEAQQIPANTTPTTLRPAPPPSIKRRESEAGVEQSEPADRVNNKKRKRGSSPPWQFPTAANTTLKTADGRRISARVNTGTPVLSESDARERSSSLSAPPARSRPESPPWKKFEAPGPTSVVVDGKRKSGRVNKNLSDAPKRVSPRSKKQADAVVEVKNRPVSAGKLANGSVSEKNGAPPPSPKLHLKESGRPSSSHNSEAKIAELRAQINALKPTRSFPSPEQPKRSHKRKPSHEDPPKDDRSSSPQAHRKAPRPSITAMSPETQRPSPRIKLRFNATRHAVPPPHPSAIPLSPTRPPKLSIWQKIEHFELLEMQQPYSENERGPPDQAWFKQRAEKQAIEEAAMRKRIIKEAEPGGLLSEERLSISRNLQKQPEPAEQYAHHDHLVAHALYLRKLQVDEKKQHRAQAKKIAHAALDYWKAKRGPTEEDIREAQDKEYRLIYKQVAVDMKMKWDMVVTHIQQQRLRVWEAEEELKRQQRLQEKLEWSENMVARQRGEADESDIDMEEDSMGDIDGSEDDESEEENMSESSSESGSNEGADAGEYAKDELTAYLAQRDDEPLDEAEDDNAEDQPIDAVDETETEHEQEDVSMAEMLGDERHEVEQSDFADVSMAESGGHETELGEDLEEDVEPDPLQSKNQHLDENAEKTADVEASARRSRRSSASPVELDDAADFSSDESTDMDSEDYDSDEDMSSTGEEDNADQEDDGSEEDSSDDQPIAKHSLLSLFKDEVKGYGLPTPTTSAEGDELEAQVELGADEQPGIQAEPGADVELAPTQDATTLDDQDDKGTSRTNVEHDDQAPINNHEVRDASEQRDVLNYVSAPESPSASIDDSTSKYLAPVPSLLRGTLRSYQHTGLDWLASLYRNGTNGILADEMGLGKTIQTIALLAHLAEEHDCWETHLVIVPTSVILNWVMEFQKFLPGFRVLGYYGTAEERQAKRRGWANDPHHENKEKRGYNVVVTSYNVAMQDNNAIRNVQWHYLVLDEAHNIRNFNSQRWQVLIRLKSRARLLLTGTPLQNSLTELWSLLTFLTAGDDNPQHGDLEEFLSHWKEPVKEIFDRGVQTLSHEAQKVVDQLHVSLRPFLLRRLKSEVERDLPKKTESVVVCKLSKRQRQLYQDYMGLADTRRSLTQGNAVSAGKVLLSLRRVCNHPDLFDPRPIQTSFAMEQSALEPFSIKERVVRNLLGLQNETPTCMDLQANEGRRKNALKRSKQLSAVGKLQIELQNFENRQSEADSDASTIAGSQALQRLKQRQQKLQHLRSCINASETNLQAVPVYGSDLRELLTIHNDRSYRVAARDMRGKVIGRSLRGWPVLGRYPLKFESDHVSDWLLSKDSFLQRSVQTAQNYADNLQETITRFAFVTPATVASVLDYTIPGRAQEIIRACDTYPIKSDYAHEARVRCSIAFPDSRLLVFDSGKLQRLTYLLRELQSRGSRSLIFTQMTGTLNILEQFLSLLNIPYLRLDGSTPVESRQLYSAEFNRPDSKYQCMILSSRAGGVGLNLVGASSVIFYDLDWNPQMDRQCMDRAHRIGQVRDVEVYKMVSEKTIEENILQRANQKSLLDQAVIQEGHFTTEYQPEHHHADGDKDHEGDDVAAAIERFLGSGNNEKATAQALESVEDKEDVQAAQQARKEEHQDDADFAIDRSSKAPTPGHVLEDDDERKDHVDHYMIRYMEFLWKDIPFVPPQVRKTDRHGRDPSHRAKRKR